MLRQCSADEAKRNWLRSRIQLLIALQDGRSTGKILQAISIQLLVDLQDALFVSQAVGTVLALPPAPVIHRKVLIR